MRPTFVVDCSAALPWLLEDEKTTETERLLERLVNEGETALAPPLLRYEVANAMLMAARRGRVAKDEMRAALSFFEKLPIEISVENGHVFSSALMLAEKHALTVYDALYLDLAIREGLPLASLDGALKKAALADGVHLAFP